MRLCPVWHCEEHGMNLEGPCCGASEETGWVEITLLDEDTVVNVGAE